MGVTTAAADHPRRLPQFGAVLAVLGVVYGDIGTSPLYAVRESALAADGHIPAAPAIMGVVSLIFWSLMIVVTLKYVVLIMQADNDGVGKGHQAKDFRHQQPRQDQIERKTQAMLEAKAGHRPHGARKRRLPMPRHARMSRGGAG